MPIRQKAGSAKLVRNGPPRKSETKVVFEAEPLQGQTKTYANYLRERYSAVRKSKEERK
jgi:hypothetical protein